MKLLAAFARFWYEFIIGDDWKIAAAVVCALSITALLLAIDVMSDQLLTILGAVLIVAAFSISLIVDVREKPAR
jgi:hypothetical protein